MDVTEADREKARHIIANWIVNFSSDDLDPLIAMVETYLAAEREKARAPFRDVVSRLRALSMSSGPAGQVAYEHAGVMVDAAGQDRS